ncbi:hypothetical protein OG618_00590 [Kitasatospora sp. NBC_01246]|uniref:hypothetical protein n=1 Tax=Kitasatospora sp. NBC_01246 TaxID=2903570 RepID=UPI002E32C09F|nr:hypothetical protein [Kitasatospora sp. NBC_01246]
MAHSLDPEDIVVVRPGGDSLAAHDRSRGNHDDNDVNDSGKADWYNYPNTNVFRDDND